MICSLNWHTWKIVEQREQPAPVELIGDRKFDAEGTFFDPMSLVERPVIVTYRCEICGKEKVERI